MREELPSSSPLRDQIGQTGKTITTTGWSADVVCENCGRPKADHALIDLASAIGNKMDLNGVVFTPVLICPRNVYVPEK